jgi:DNA primase
MSTWIDFKALRQTISFSKVLDHYGFKGKGSGSQVQGFCPLPNHTGERKKSKSFSANIDRGVFQCFSCRGKGNVLDLIALSTGTIHDVSAAEHATADCD